MLISLLDHIFNGEQQKIKHVTISLQIGHCSIYLAVFKTTLSFPNVKFTAKSIGILKKHVTQIQDYMLK